MKIFLLFISIIILNLKSQGQNWQDAGSGNPLETESSIKKLRLLENENRVYLLRDFVNNPSGISMDTLSTENDEWAVYQSQNSADDYIVHNDGSFTTLEITSTHFLLTTFESDNTLSAAASSLPFATFDIELTSNIELEVDENDNFYISFFDLTDNRPKLLKYDGLNFTLIGNYVINEALRIQELDFNSNQEPFVLLTRIDHPNDNYDHILLKHNGTAWDNFNELNIINNSNNSFSSFNISDNDSIYITYTIAGGFSNLATVCRVNNNDTTIIKSNLNLDGETLNYIKILADNTEKLHILTSSYSLGWNTIYHYSGNDSNWTQHVALPSQHDTKITGKFSAIIDTLNSLYLAYSIIDSPFEIDPDTSYFVRRLPNCNTINALNIVTMDESNVFSTSFLNATDYQWITCENNEIIDNANTYEYQGVENIEYAVITDKYGCIDTSNCVSNIIDVSSLTEQPKMNIIIYPNPSYKTIYFDNLPIETSSIKIYNIAGELVESIDMKVSFIDVNHFETGVYFVEVHSDTEKQTIKFIKN